MSVLKVVNISILVLLISTVIIVESYYYEDDFSHNRQKISPKFSNMCLVCVPDSKKSSVLMHACNKWKIVFVQETRRTEATDAAARLTSALVDHLNVGVAQAYLNQVKINGEDDTNVKTIRNLP